jgi:phage terminase small subunit
MPRGGFRPGAGRPKGSGKAAKKAPAKKAATKKRAKAEKIAVLLPEPPKAAQADQVVDGVFVPARLDPLTFMLDVMNHPGVDLDTRSRMAIAAAPYCHVRKGDGGKKDAKQSAAGAATNGRFGPAPPPLHRRPN